MEMLAVNHLALTALNEARSDDAASLAACGGNLIIKNNLNLTIILFQSLMLQKRLVLKYHRVKLRRLSRESPNF